MDINDMRVAVTVMSLILFLGIMVWTLQNKRREAFEEAAALPFAPEASDAAVSTGEQA